MPPTRALSAGSEVLAAAALGVLAALGASLLTAPRFAILIGWDVAVAAYLLNVWLRVWHLDDRETERLALRADPTRPVTDLLVLSAASASLAAVGVVLASATHVSGTPELLRVGLGLVSVVLSWAVVHTVFALRYARLYYTPPNGGVDFKQEQPPAYADFAYLAFTIGMTFQVSDTDLQKQAIRLTALRHALLAFVFGTGILATTVNLVASLTTGR